MNIAYVNNKFIPLGNANISILDRGLLYGDGVFETLRSYGGKAFYLKKHIKRLAGSLKTLGIHLPTSESGLEKIVYKLLKENRLKNAYIKIIVTRGKSYGLLYPSRDTKPSIIIYTLPYKKRANNIYKKGLKVTLIDGGFNENFPMAGHKTLNYLGNMLFLRKARTMGFDDVLLKNTRGSITEASGSNIFLVKNKKLLTPSKKTGALPGITRGEIIRLAKKALKCPVRETFIKPETLYRADEIFLTNSLAEVVPVVMVNNRTIGKGLPGPLTQKISSLYKKSVMLG